MVNTANNEQLLAAVQLVESGMQADARFPGITELLHASSSGEYTLPIPSDWQVISKQKTIPLPDALFEQYDLLECRCFMGLFPEIKRAWITVDHRLFLWNYEDETDFYSFEDQEQIIVSVALVKPKPGVFVDTISYILVIATPLEVFLLGVGYDKSKLASTIRSGGGDVTLYATQISVPADGIAMTSITGTREGRVFMSGNDGNLYEFVYQAEDGWLSKRARKVNLTSTLASYFIPTFLAHSRDVSALQMAVDDDRKLLYVLLQDSSIKVFWLGAQGNEFAFAHHQKTIHNSAALLCPQFNEGGSSGGTFEIVSMHVIPPSESRTLSLVAITSGGCRLYFSTTKRMQRFYDSTASVGLTSTAAPVPRMPDVFEIIHVRLPPEMHTSPAPNGLAPLRSRPTLNVHTSYYKSGATLMAGAWSEDHDSVVGAAPDCAQIISRIAKQPRVTMTEHSSTLRIDGRTWAIAEVDSLAQSSVGNNMNDLATVENAPTTRFAILTNAGVSILEKQRPVDMLKSLVSHPSFQDAYLREFIGVYGLDEVCAMCFNILCSDDYDYNLQRRRTISMQAMGTARKILFELGGAPHHAASSVFAPGAPSANGAVASVPSVSDKIVLSGRHNGLAIYLARTLAPIWKMLATSLKADKLGARKLHIGVSTLELDTVQSRLQCLQHFINTNQRFVPDQLNQLPLEPPTTSGSPSIAAARPNDLTSLWQEESASLASLYDLLVKSIEAISFLCLLADFNLPIISESMSDEEKKTLADITFADLICTERGHQICKDLTIALINSQLKQHSSVDSISDVLSKRCSTIFSLSDVSLYKALELLRRATDPESLDGETQELSDESLSLLLEVAGSLNTNKLKEICDSFESLSQYQAVLSLCLACAAQSDPQDEAMGFWDDGAPVGDRREVVYRKRMECYKIVIDMIDGKRNVFVNAKTLSSLPRNDTLFHFALYDWLLANDQASILFQIGGVFIEQYLTIEPKTVEKYDMLWHYYIHENQFGKAAFVQRELANTRSFGDGASSSTFVDLPKRIEYISLSISNAKIAIDRVRNSGNGNQRREILSEELTEEEEIDALTNLLRENEDQLEIAQVQLEIQRELLKKDATDYRSIVDALNSRLYNVTELYDKFAEPLKLWDALLLIFKVSNHDDPQMVEEIWLTILRTILDDQMKSGLLAVAAKVSDLGSRLYPSSAAFPLPLVASILMELANERPGEYTVGYLSNALLSANVPHWAVFEALNLLYTRLASNNAGGADVTSGNGSDDALAVLAREIAELTKSWINISSGGGGGRANVSGNAAMNGAQGSPVSASGDSLPVMAVDDALSQYIINAASNNNHDLMRELQQVQDQIRKIF